MKKIVAQEWYEYERGWGAKSEGFTLHINVKDLQTYIKNHLDKLPKLYVPNVYLRPEGLPFYVRVSETHYKEVRKNRPGVFTDKIRGRKLKDIIEVRE